MYLSRSTLSTWNHLIEAPLEDQPLLADASPIAASPDYVADFDPEEDPKDDQADYPANGWDGDDEPFDDDDDDDTDDEDPEEEPFEDEEGRRWVLGSWHVVWRRWGYWLYGESIISVYDDFWRSYLSRLLSVVSPWLRIRIERRVSNCG
nr:hypothetical protein [Tanacetum cinerariifolium]